MNIKLINLDNQVHKIICTGTFYKPLILALWKILSIDDKNSITFNNKNDDKIILLNDIFKFFIYKIKNVDVENNCLCGQDIFHNKFIYHINTLKEYVVGSECISCWNNPIDDKQVKVSSELS